MSFGVLLSADWGPRPAEELLHEVAVALYQAKGAGRDCLRIAHPAVQVEVPTVVAPQPAHRNRR